MPAETTTETRWCIHLAQAGTRCNAGISYDRVTRIGPEGELRLPCNGSGGARCPSRRWPRPERNGESAA